jgi:hypothetical protein
MDLCGSKKSKSYVGLDKKEKGKVKFVIVALFGIFDFKVGILILLLQILASKL